MLDLKEMSCEELANLSKRGVITELAITQQELIDVLVKIIEMQEQEKLIRQKLEGLY